ncbi:hypothetical protein [Amphritea balenae]|uniref:DUF4405 domain-containing protein n=1 Tax=Amphritea balenae TaxID=452629 RepID=A0A3P1SQS0_9GAMM|nr:hypothetical protein [Amphritea balenae]RRC98995.1 hypothetical protein EHS89_12570 [Amphritea balenae]
MSNMNIQSPSVATTDASLKPAIQSRLGAWWRHLAYRHKAAELSLYLLFITGLPLWSLFEMAWSGERFLLLAHFLGSIILFPLLILPFWLSHRRLWQSSKNQKLRNTGYYLDLLMLVCALSGIYLLLLGNRGEWLGYISHYLHLVTAIPLSLLLLFHAARWSVLRPLYRPFIRR